MADGRAFLKASTTQVTVEKSKEDLRKLVRRYGAAGFSVAENYEEHRATIELVLPDRPGSDVRVPLRIPVHVPEVAARLPLPDHRRAKRTEAWAEAQRWEQAERTAWRIAVDLVDAMLMAVELGGRTVSEAFMADVVVVREDGGTERMAEFMARTGGVLPGGARALLGPGEATR